MSSQKCDICFEEKPETSFGFLPCTHSFCKNCLGLLRQNVCPMCRNPFQEYSQYNYAHSAPTESHFIPMEGKNETRDDLYLEETAVVQRRLNVRQRRRMRRRRRRLRTNRRPRRSERVDEEIFEIEIDIETTSITDEKIDEQERIKSRKPRGDMRQQLNSQRSRYAN